MPLRPGLIINNPQRRLPEEQRRIFADNGWEIVDAAPPAHQTPPPLCYSSVWLSMNVLIIDHKTVVAEASEVYQLEQLDSLGFEVIPVPFGMRIHSVADYTALQLTCVALGPAKIISQIRSKALKSEANHATRRSLKMAT